MELKLFVSGVPSGENLWGNQSDSTYFGTLYINSKENMKFDIRLNKTDSKIYAYYHYLVYNTINDYDGRTGSYFGLTIRLDSFCIDFRTIYNVLDIIYRKKIVGTILKEVNGGRLQFTCPSFDKRDAELSDLEKTIRNLLGTSLYNSDFRSIPSMPTGKGLIKLNWDDASQSNVIQAVGQYAFCSISSEYESQSVIARLKEEYQRGSASRQNEINILSGELQDANKKEDALQEEIKKLKKPSTIPSHEHHAHVYEHSHHRNSSNKGLFSFLKNPNYIIGGLLVIIASILGYYYLVSDDTSEKIYQTEEVSNDSISIVHSIVKEEEICPSASIQIVQKDQDELDEKVSYTITVSGLDEYADKMCLASVGKVIFISTNIYEVNECPKDSDLVVTFVTTNTEDKRTINLKSNTYKHDK